MKYEIASELGINLKDNNPNGFNEITKRLARIGEEYVKNRN